MTVHDWFGLVWEGTLCLLLLTLIQGPPQDYESRAATVWLWAVALMAAVIATGVAGRLLTPGSFWHA